MKKTLFLLMVTLTILVTSCKKDDNSLTPDKLVGTTWLYTDNSLGIKIIFVSKTLLSFHSQEGSYPAYDDEGLYKINGSSFTVDLVYETINGAFDGNTLNIQYASQICALKKQ